MKKRDTSVGNVLSRRRRKRQKKKEWCMWPCHKKHNKKSKEEVQHTFYDERYRSTVERTFPMRHAY